MDKSAEMAVLGIFQTGINERRNCFGGKLDSIAPVCEFRYPLATQLKSGIRPEGGGGLAGSMAVPDFGQKTGGFGREKTLEASSPLPRWINRPRFESDLRSQGL